MMNTKEYNILIMYSKLLKQFKKIGFQNINKYIFYFIKICLYNIPN